MADTNHQPGYIPQIGIPEKSTFQERNYTKAIYHRATAPGFFGVIILCFFMAFINIKCGGTVVASYTGVEIMRGVDKAGSTKQGITMIGVRQSAYNQLEIARANYKWKKDLKENYETYVDDAPVLENDFSAIDDYYKMPESYEETTSNPKTTSTLASLAFIAACIGSVLSFLKKKFGTVIQIIAGFSGFVLLFMMQLYVKVTIPKSGSSSMFSNEYSSPMVTTQFALGYWVALFLFLAVAILGLVKLRWQKKMNESIQP
jgi:succinate dehydrogenase/fumarate reductase cytochrome b subunit